MRRSPRRPLILKRRKLPFNQHDPPSAPDGGPASTATAAPTKPPPPPPRLDESFPKPTTDAAAPANAASLCHFPDGVIQIMAHPTLPDTQVVVIPQTVTLQSVIGALTAKGKEHGPNGPHKFILLGGGDPALLLPASGVAPDAPARPPPPPPPQMSAGGGGGGPGLVPGVGMVKQEPSHPDNKPLLGLKPCKGDGSIT